ncbi:alpha/beta fold hydrolase [Marisediminicola sp. LYQ85]|uniref:alpha/beta fold hydrolase n=1 Tax=Marisediminicola sp. LYQ85 TaxID=3391062 RepID=UPI003982E66A
MRATVIFVHGLRTSATMWRHQLAELEAAGIPAVALDLPGHGSRRGERFTMRGALDAIGEAVDAAPGPPPYLVGFSLGGYLAIEYLARDARPQRVSGLLAASCGTTPTPLVIGAWRVLAKMIRRLPDQGLALNNLMVRRFVPEPGATDVIAGGVALDVMDDVLRDLVHLDPVAALPGIAAPILFVNGRLDHVRWHAARYLRAARTARLVTVPKATHMVSVTHPDRFTRELLDEYRRVAAP